MKITICLMIFLLTVCNWFGRSTGSNDKGNVAQIQSGSNFCHDTLLINGSRFIQTTNEDTTRFYCLTALNGDTIIPFTDYYHHMKLLDIDENGSTDIRVFIFSNTPNQCNNYLFNSQQYTYKLIENCDLDIKKISGTDLYYSYNAAGCSDMNWESHLSKIENYYLVTCGRIYGNGCDDRQDKRTIEIYNVSGEKETLIKTLSYSNHINRSVDKWMFIEQYWTNNWRKFN